MKKLVLIRHAKSDWSNSRMSDFDRPLNSRGIKDAPIIAEKLKEDGIIPDLILSSTANRALSTARLIANEYLIPFEEIKQIPSLYLGSLQDLFTIADRSADQGETLFLIAHNPGISYLASHLSSREIQMPTCCAVVLEFPGDGQLDNVKNCRIYKPKDFK